MKFTRLIFFSLAILCGVLFCSSETKATSYVMTGFLYDSGAGKVYGTSQTYLDYTLNPYYDAEVYGYLIKYNDSTLTSNTTIAYGYDSDSFNAAVFTEANIQRGEVYAVWSRHFIDTTRAYPYYPYYPYDPYGLSNNYYNSNGSNGYYSLTYHGPALLYNVQIELGWTGVIVGLPNISQVAPSSGQPGTTPAVQIIGKLLGETNNYKHPVIVVSGNGITAQFNNFIPTGIEVFLQIAEDADVGQHTIQIYADGVPSNLLTFTVGDRSPQITGITPDIGLTGTDVPVTITGTGFGVNPELQVGPAGVTYTIVSMSATQIQALFSISGATYIGPRNVSVKSHGFSGNGFIQSSGGSDTSNAVPFGITTPIVELPTTIPIVEKNGERTINLTIRGIPEGVSYDTKITINPIDNATGEARFSNTNSNIITFHNNVIDYQLKINGITESSAVDKMALIVNSNNSPNDTTELTRRVFTVATISSLVFQKYGDDYENIDTNPGTGKAGTITEGRRFYPDKKNVADLSTTSDRSLVKVIATVSPAAANIPVNFKNFDLDDPSATDFPLDKSGTSGDDNKGEISPGRTAGLLTGDGCTTDPYSIKNCPTSSNGTYIATFKTTLNPGDNFGIAASLTDSYLSSLTFNSLDGTKLVDRYDKHIPISGTVNSDNVPAIRTEMLTVWRKVHIEIDSMGNVTGNRIEGTLTETKKVSTGMQTLQLSVSDLEPDRFDGGRILITHGTYTREVKVRNIVRDSTDAITVHANTDNSVTLNNNLGGVFNIYSGDTFILYDDDDYNDDDGSHYDGDDGEPLIEPDMSLLTNTDTACSDSVTSGCNILASAFIKPYYDLSGSHEKTPFILNLPMSKNVLDDSPIPGEVQAAFDFDNSSYSARDDFWVIYMSSAYQIDTKYDGDPKERAVLGIADTNDGSGQGSLLFLETSRAKEGGSSFGAPPKNRAYTVAHEVGHSFGGNHGDGELMATETDSRITKIFGNITLNKMRGGTGIFHP